VPDIRFTGDQDADQLLSDSPLALLVGMLLDQQMPMERAFLGPLRLRERLGHLDAARIAAMPPEELEEVFAQTPAVHRFPSSMARRTGDLCRALVEDHGGDAAAVWQDVEDATQLKRRLAALPGFGRQKVKVFTALLAKQCGVTPEGWQDVAGEYAEEGHRSVADVDEPEDVRLVRETKRAKKAD
jgi:uncharacterized HhH-GPD family protein